MKRKKEQCHNFRDEKLSHGLFTLDEATNCFSTLFVWHTDPILESKILSISGGVPLWRAEPLQYPAQFYDMILRVRMHLLDVTSKPGKLSHVFVDTRVDQGVADRP